MFKWILLLLSSVMGSLAMTALGADAGLSRTTPSQGISTTITSQRMTVHNQDGQAIFEGSVVLTKGTLVVHSDKMVVSFRPTDQGAVETKNGETGNKAEVSREKERGGGARREAFPVMSNRSVSTIEATGRVKIDKEGGRATCQKAVFYQDEEKIVLTGEPIAWEKGTRVTGKQITMFLAEDRSVVEGGSHVMIEGEGGSGR